MKRRKETLTQKNPSVKAAEALPQSISFLSGSVAPLKNWIHRAGLMTTAPPSWPSLGARLGGGAGLAPGAGTWVSRRSAAADSELPDVAPVGDREEAQNPPLFLMNPLLKMEAQALPEPASLGAGGRAAGRRRGVKARDPPSPRPAPGGRGRVARPSRQVAPQLQADVTAAAAGLRGPRQASGDGDKPMETNVLCGCSLLPRPSLPKRMIGYLISPGLNSWQRGRWFATGNKT